MYDAVTVPDRTPRAQLTKIIDLTLSQASAVFLRIGPA